mgnify:CR=1 FL=1
MNVSAPRPTAVKLAFEPDTVDLAIGTEFSEISHNDDIDAVLASLRPDATQPADSALLSKIHSVAC